MPLITSRGNRLIKQARALRQRKARSETGLFLVEGIHHVGAAVEAGWDVETLFYAPGLLTSDYARGLIADSVKLGISCQPVSPDAFLVLSGKDNPQGLLAVVRQRAQRLDDFSPQSFRRGAALVAPQDPGNVGTILRTLDAIGADGLFLLDGGVDVYHPKAVRASMGALFWVPVVRGEFAEFADWARRGGYRLVGTSARAETDYRSLDFGATPWILLLGSEQKGLAAGQAAACDVTVSLPMRGHVSSLNLAVAAGVLLYALGEEER
ncbi:MAG: RNA methyltransferase [Chloroflexi bacterium]|nr:RNA methyltransferase [Chloroflexota bacterium]